MDREDDEGAFYGEGVEMGAQTNISWTDFTWNVARGCSKVDEGCRNCYMMRDGDRWGYDGKTVIRTKTAFTMPLRYKGKSQVWDGPPLGFVSSLTDFLHPDIDAYRHEAFAIMRKRPDLHFQVLTKRPERRLICNWPDDPDLNSRIWFGTSVAQLRDMQRVHTFGALGKNQCVRFVSIEPLIEEFHGIWHYLNNYLDWVIIGGESGNENGKWRYRRCELHWIRSIIKVCRSEGVPVFVKQLGTHLSKQLGLKDRHGTDINEWPEDLKVREFPNLQEPHE